MRFSVVLAALFLPTASAAAQPATVAPSAIPDVHPPPQPVRIFPTPLPWRAPQANITASFDCSPGTSVKVSISASPFTSFGLPATYRTFLSRLGSLRFDGNAVDDFTTSRINEAMQHLDGFPGAFFLCGPTGGELSIQGLGILPDGRRAKVEVLSEWEHAKLLAIHVREAPARAP